MAKIHARPTMDLQLAFIVSEAEARALDGLAGYGDDAFIKHFYEKLGEHYMKPHEAGLREFLRTVREFIPPYLGRIDRARSCFTKGEDVPEPPEGFEWDRTDWEGPTVEKPWPKLKPTIPPSHSVC